MSPIKWVYASVSIFFLLGFVYVWHQLGQLSMLKDKAKETALIQKEEAKYKDASQHTLNRLIQYERSKNKVKKEAEAYVQKQSEGVDDEEDYTIFGSDSNSTIK